MNRKGHVGMALLAYAPVAYLLITDGKLVLAVLGWLGIQAVEPLPDQDFHLPFLTHRSLSHSLVAVLVVGGVLGAIGWLLGDRLFDLLYAVFSIGGNLWGRLLDHLPDLSASLLAGIVPNIPPSEIVDTIKQRAGGTVDRRGFATFGFAVGAGGILAHLLGDIITKQGIKPLLPLSRWQLSLSSLRADSPTANFSLFFIGVLAVVVVLGATVPSLLLGAVTPAHLSPVGVAAGQDVGRTTNQSAASVTIQNQTTNGSTVTIERVTLPDNGFVGIHVASNSKNGSLGPSSLIAVSDHLSVGTYRNVTITIPRLNGSQTVVAVPYRDTNDNNQFDATKVFGTGSTAFTTTSGSVVKDTARVRVRASTPIANQTGTQTQNTTNSGSRARTGAGAGTNASTMVAFTNQTTSGTNVTISSVTLSKGGFVVIHGPGYANQGIVSGSAITVSRYLSPGTHRNVTIQFSNGVPGAVSNVSEFSGAYAPLSAVVYADTNGNHHYDYVESVGQNDTAYRRNGSRVDDQARVVTQDQLDRKTQPTAAVTLTNQSAADGTLTVERVRLPHGGWVVVHNQTYLAENDPLTSVGGRSTYLSAGVHRNVTVRLDQPLTRSQTVVAVPYRDTNGNKRYDYLRSGGVYDAGYVNRTGQNATIVTDRAHVSVPSPTTTPAHTSAPTTAGTLTAQATPTTDRPPASGGVLSSLSVWFKGVLVVVGVVLGLTIIGRVT
jgi:membrane-bound metal-dependent hydrolase YbcI (DUF457 family)